VAELEAKFSSLLGKEDTVFMPTGTLANHIALRLLCGEPKHALVQQESHVYRDESIPSPPSAASTWCRWHRDARRPRWRTRAAIERAEVGPYPIKVGAIALESPVRRAQGACLSPALVAEIARRAREKHPMHLDGARLLLMSGMAGFRVKTIAATSTRCTSRSTNTWARPSAACCPAESR
jgi:threonine aldolase